MIHIRKSADRGYSSLDWLKSHHSFSFSSYYDPEHMGFHSLRVINDDRVAPGAGFRTHPHDNMEIISYVLSGALEHKDSMGYGSIIRPGEVQRLSAGTGITHSEFNHSQEHEVHFLQIWFLPDTLNVKPGYAQKAFSEEEKRGRFCLVASKTGRHGSVTLHQDMDMSVALLDGDENVTYPIHDHRAVWVHIARGAARINGYDVQQGDGMAVTGENQLVFSRDRQAEILVFDMLPVSS